MTTSKLVYPVYYSVCPRCPERGVARLTVPVLLALLACGCTDQTGQSTAAGQAASSTAVAPTTTVQRMTAEELAWLKAVTSLRDNINKPFLAGNIQMTRAKMVELGHALGACRRQLRRIGTPSDRLAPVHAVVKKACRTYDKGASCFATAARVSSVSGSVVVGTPEQRTHRRSIDCGMAAQGDGSNLLTQAETRGNDLKAMFG
jgi:hypothetical protein